MSIEPNSRVFVGGAIAAFGSVIGCVGRDVYRDRTGGEFLMRVFGVRLHDGSEYLAFENALIDVTRFMACRPLALQPGGQA